MAEGCSLHEKASRVLPELGTKSTTIIAAILKADKDASRELGQEDFLWIKCSAKISIEKIHQQYEIKREGNAPWVLKHDGQPANLETTMGVLNVFDDNLVVFEAVNVSTASSVIASPRRPVKFEKPLSPKDINPRIQATTPLPSKPTLPGNHDENADVRPYPAIDSVLRVPTPTQTHHGPNGPPRHQSPFPDASPNMARDVSPRPPPYGQQQQSPGAQVTSVPHVKVEQGHFPRYHDAWVDRYKAAYPGESEDQVGRRLWSSWLLMGETERSAYAPSPESASDIAEFKASSRDRVEASNDRKTSAAVNVTEPPNSSTKIGEQQPKHFQLSAMLKDATPQVLEASVEASIELLNTLRAPLTDKMANSPDAEQWVQQIDNLKKQAVKTKTVIGVVGNTGAGKSSVINAMLDEERLVPTNCMRACTAVVTEISYNYQEQPYCAEIEFISAQDWAKELNVLFQDLLDGDGKVSRECANEDTDAGIAYAKIKAVYPQKTKEDISNTNIDSLLREVSHILGTSRNIKEKDSPMFYKKLQSYVDSKEKSTGKKDKDGKKEKKEREFWPLIRVVRLYVKSPALATGAVIVDLPGVHDANAARAAVAEGYMKQCTGLWIVAPINRAVDDKAAKSLLGESFKRQLKMDGGFSAVTFICSKTDDISLMEAQDSLGLDEQMGPSWDEMDRLSAEQKNLEKHLKELRETKAVYEEVAYDADEQIEVWETLKEAISDGKVVYSPKPKLAGKKRKSTVKKQTSRKKRKTDLSDIEDSDFNDKETDEDEDADGSGNEALDDESEDREPLTEKQITSKLQELKTTKKDGRNQKREITERMADIRQQINEARDAESTINSEMSAMCISGRNQYSKGAIQQDFAAGIKELDQEIAAEEDEENFDPDAVIRDYDEVAKALPVFCVSSRGYQKLQGRLKKDPHVPGFTTIGETEIPALQAHCEKLTETGRAANCRAFINKLSQLLNSLTLWASSDGTGANLSPEQKAKEARYLQKGLEGLETGLENATKTSARELNDEFEDSIFEKYETAIQNASRDSIDTTLKWGAPVNRENRAAGGLYWATYKAICRRNGSFTNNQGLHDWNAQLTEPMIKIIAPGWEKTFTRRVQMVLNNFTRVVPNALKKFHREIEARARKIGAGIAGLSMLSQQVSVYEQILKDLATTTKDMIITRQKDINREFVPAIERAMQDSYVWCMEEHGSGCFARMKAHMNSHVADHRHVMFQESADEVKRQLASLVTDVENTMGDKTDEVFIQIKRDYRSVLGGGEVPQGGEVLPRVERQVRKEIKRTIVGVEGMMRKVVGLEVEEISKVEEWDSESEGEEDNTLMETGTNNSQSHLPGIKREAASQAAEEVTADGVQDEQDEDTGPSLTEAKDDADSTMRYAKPEDESSEPSEYSASSDDDDQIEDDQSDSD